MTGIYGVLQMGRQALATQQTGINVTAENIANVNTPGYSRKRPVMETLPPVTTGEAQIGTGVTTREIERAYDRHLTDQIADESEHLGKWEAEKDGLERVEMVFNESSGFGLSQYLGEFWNAWEDLVNNPSGASERKMLAGAGETLAAYFQRTYNDLCEIQDELNRSVGQTVDAINLKAGEIAGLNEKIIRVETGGVNANDYRDSRDMLVKELSRMVDVAVSEQENGALVITLGDGNRLVEGSSSFDLTTLKNRSGLDDVAWASNPTASINASLSGGMLDGCLEVRDAAIPGYKNDLEDLAEAIKTKVNELHKKGYGLDGTTDKEFFAGSLSQNNFAISTDISEDVNKIAASATLTGLPGDSANAMAIAELQYDLTMDNGTASFNEHYIALVSRVGQDVQRATAGYDQQEAMLSHLENRRESISGVSLDEEMINMLQFETAYEAAAKLINTVDKMLDTLMSIV